MELVLTWRPTLETARRFVQCLHPKMRRHSDPGNGPPPVSHCPLNDFASSRPPLKRWFYGVMCDPEAVDQFRQKYGALGPSPRI